MQEGRLRPMIARKRVSCTRPPIGSRAHEENCQQLHDPVVGSPSLPGAVERGDPAPQRHTGQSMSLRGPWPNSLSVYVMLLIISVNLLLERSFPLS
jgi:hypothetical protein